MRYSIFGVPLLAIAMLAGLGVSAPPVQMDWRHHGSATDKPATLTVGIGGDFVVADNETCTWTAIVSGGQSPYTYEWQIPGLGVVSTSDSYTGNTGSQDFQIRLSVEDANSDVEVAREMVDVILGGPSACGF